MAEILHQLRLVVYPIIYRVSYIPGGAGFQPSTVCSSSLFTFLETSLDESKELYILSREPIYTSVSAM